MRNVTTLEPGTTIGGFPGGDDAAARSLPRLLTFLLPATASMYAIFNGLQQIVIPARVEALDPAGKVANLGLLTSVAAIASLLALPIGGAVSDRTRTRLGRRAPWLLLMSALAGALTILLGYSHSVVVLGTIYIALWFVANFYQGAITAILPDRVPVRRRGVASSVIGLATPLGILFGVNAASHLPMGLACWLLGATFLVTSIMLVLNAPDASSMLMPRTQRTRVRVGDAVGDFLSAFRSADFSWAFASRFMLFLSYFLVAGYLYYTLQDYVGIARLPFDTIAKAVGTLVSLNVVSWLIVSSFCGYLADRLDRRKLFVGVSALGVAACMVIPILFPTWHGMMAYSILSGAFIGVYFAVDLALMSLVLPDKENEGRDFGILAVATGLPQIMSSAVAAAIISWAGGYQALYGFASVFGVLSCIFVLKIKSVR